MSDRLFIGAVGHAPRDSWGAAVASPPILRNVGSSSVISPRTDRSRFLELCIGGTGSILHLSPLGQVGKDYRDHVEGQDTILLAPIGGGSTIPASGFALVDDQHKALRHFVPVTGSKTGDRLWPDWRFELAIRGLALFTGVPARTDARPGPDVVLGKAVEERPPGSLVAWLNPLVVGFAGDLAVPGLDWGAPGKVYFTNAIKAAVAAGQWLLVPSLSTPARRRLLGWQTFCTHLTTSLLGELFLGDSRDAPGPQLNPVRLADLAALDELEGVFHLGADREAAWQWAPPAGEANPAAAQLRAVLLEALGLVSAPETAPERYSWFRALPGAGRQLVELPGLASSPVEAKLASAATFAAGRQIGAALSGFAELGRRVAADMPSEAPGLLARLPGGVFHERQGKVSVDLDAELQLIAAEFLAPQSPMVASLGRPIVAEEKATVFAEEWAARSIDLFESPGNGVVEALLTILQPRTVATESRYDGNWQSIYWRHCMVGDKSTPFRLTPDDGGLFTLDNSLLDGPDVLSEASA